jgi:proteasome assembly chaperone (PAC2) family protein
MIRAFLIALGTLAGIVAGIAVGYWLWGQAAHRLPAADEHAHALERDLDALQTKAKDMEQRVDQVSREEERLAQENAILRTERTTEQLLGGQGAGGPTPTLPPK